MQPRVTLKMNEVSPKLRSEWNLLNHKVNVTLGESLPLSGLQFMKDWTEIIIQAS